MIKQYLKMSPAIEALHRTLNLGATTLHEAATILTFAQKDQLKELDRKYDVLLKTTLKLQTAGLTMERCATSI